MFRREQRRPLYADKRNDIRRIRPQAREFHPRQRLQTHDAPYLEEIPSGPIRPRRSVPTPQYYKEEPITHVDHYNSYQSNEPDLGPKPLLDSDTIEKLRANLNMVNEKLNQVENRYRLQNEKRNRDQYEDRVDDRVEDRFDDKCEYRYEDACDREPKRYERRYEPRPGPSSIRRSLIEKEYVQEEESTKETIEEIIMVAQALREKLRHREEPALEHRNDPVLEYRREPVPEHRHVPIPDIRHPIEFYEEGCEPLPPYPRRRPPLLKTPNIKPIPLKAPDMNNHRSSELIKNPTKIPSLLEIKPKIPSLLEIQVEPPEVESVQENVEFYNRFAEPRTRDICWNCNKVGHRHEVCWFPPKEFCYRCGTQGVNDETCPNCPSI